MDDALIERAVEAGAKAAYKRANPDFEWGSLRQATREAWCDTQRRVVTAALTEVEADIRADAIRMTPSARLLYELAGRIEKEDKA